MNCTAKIAKKNKSKMITKEKKLWIHKIIIFTLRYPCVLT